MGRKVFDGTVADGLLHRAAPAGGGRRSSPPTRSAGAPGLTASTAEFLDGGRMRLTGQLAPGAPVRGGAEGGVRPQPRRSPAWSSKEPHLHDAFIALTGGPAGLQAVAAA